MELKHLPGHILVLPCPILKINLKNYRNQKSSRTIKTKTLQEGKFVSRKAKEAEILAKGKRSTQQMFMKVTTCINMTS